MNNIGKKTRYNVFLFILLTIIFFLFSYLANANILIENFGTDSFNFNSTYGTSITEFTVNNTIFNFSNNIKTAKEINFTNKWKYVYSSTSLPLYKNSSNTTFINTPQGVSYSTQDIGGATGNIESALIYIFPENIRLSESDRISFYCSNLPIGNGVLFSFGNWNTKKINLMISNDPCDLVDIGKNCCLFYNYINDDCGNSTKHFINVSVSEIMEYCSYDESERFGLNYFAIHNVGGSSGYIDDISFTYSNLTNNLPSFNISVDNSIACINSSKNENAVFNVTLNANDPENDTIYYSMLNLEEKNFNKTISFNDRYCITFFCENRPNQDFLMNVLYKYNETCLINDNEFGLFQINSSKYMLGLSSYLCSLKKDKTFYYKYPYALDNVWQYMKIYRFGNDGEKESFNLTFYDFSYNIISLLKFDTDGINQTVYNWNGTTFNLLKSFANKDPLSFTVKTGKNHTDNYLFIDNVIGGVFNISAFFNDSLIQYFTISINDSTIIAVDNIVFSGVYPDFAWQTNNSLKVNISDIGLIYYSFFVKDAEHFGNEYVFKSYAFNVVECSEYIDTTTTKEVFKSLKEGLMGICSSLDTGFKFGSFGVCSLLAWAWVLVSIILAIIIYTIFSSLSPNIMFEAGVLCFGVCVWLGSFLIDFSSVFMVFVSITIALSVIMIILNVLDTGSGGDNPGV